MIRKFCLSLAVLLTASISFLSAQQTAKVTSSGIGYLEYLPQGYHSNSDKYPLVISLHGIREKGANTNNRERIIRDLARVDNVGLPKYVRMGKKYPFILISPQLKSNYGVWPASYVIEVVNYVKKHLRVDDRRIYLTGLSLGGFGVWRTAGDYPEVFAAIAPICPGGNALKKANEIAAKNLPAWGFHGSGDKVVSYHVTTKMINAINSAPRKPNPLAKATIFPGMGHDIWDKAYNQTDVLDWMLRHRRGSASSGGHDDDDRDDDDDDNDNGGRDEDNDNEGKDKDDDKNNGSSNQAPVARAGADRTVVLPENSVYIQGTAFDRDGKVKSLKWSKVSGGSVGMAGTGASKLRLHSLREGTYVFRLTARDNKGAYGSDDVTVVVRKSGNNNSSGDNDKNNNKNNKPSSRNVLPVASAGPDRVLTLPTNAITIQASAKDKDGRIVSYEWAKTYGNRASLSGANTSRVRISNLQRGVYIFRLRVTDNDGGVRDDLFKITVKDGKSKDVTSRNDRDNHSRRSNDRKNSAPYVNAGPDRLVSLPGNAITIQGRASDRDGRIVSYEWKKTYGNRASLSGAHSSRVRISNLQRGIYIFKLIVEDNDGAVNEDYFKITVRGRDTARNAEEDAGRLATQNDSVVGS